MNSSLQVHESFESIDAKVKTIPQRASVSVLTRYPPLHCGPSERSTRDNPSLVTARFTCPDTTHSNRRKLNQTGASKTSLINRDEPGRSILDDDAQDRSGLGPMSGNAVPKRR